MPISVSSVDVSVIVTFHREGAVARTVLAALDQCREYAARRGFQSELIAVLDDPDTETRRNVLDHCDNAVNARHLELNAHDPAVGRNQAVAIARGVSIAIVDGDDLLSVNWLVASIRELRRLGRPAAVHPELVLEFGASWGVTRLPDMRHDRVSAIDCLSTHLWVSTCLAPRDLLTEIPYLELRSDGPLGFEDWHWSCELIAAGHQHITAPRTALFYRKKAASLLKRQERELRVVPHSRLFSTRFLAQRISESPPQAVVRPVPKRSILQRLSAGVREAGGSKSAEDEGAYFSPPTWIQPSFQLLCKLEPELASIFESEKGRWRWWYPRASRDFAAAFVEGLRKVENWGTDCSWIVNRHAENMALEIKKVGGSSEGVTADEGCATVSLRLTAPRTVEESNRVAKELVCRLGLAARPRRIELSGDFNLNGAPAAALQEEGICVVQCLG